MKPLFRVPGVGGFAWAMGMASGNPAGAKISSRLRQEGQVSKIEAERLAAFTNSSNPLFIFGAVSVGFFNNPKLGIVLARNPLSWQYYSWNHDEVLWRGKYRKNESK